MSGWYSKVGRKPKPKTKDILPEDVVKAIFLQWEPEARLDPGKFTERSKLIMDSADSVAGANTKRFLQYAKEMGFMS